MLLYTHPTLDFKALYGRQSVKLAEALEFSKAKYNLIL